MDNIDLNNILNRKKIEEDFKKKLLYFEQNKNNLDIKRGFFFYGNPGVGKTKFVVDILKSLNYDVIMYDSGDIRNKSIIDSITKYNMNDKNILSMFTKNPQKIVIVMDEIDSMNNGDKGGLSSLIKLVREKKTKKQKLEEYSLNPVICIGNYHFDKKLTELKKVCNSYELKKPTPDQVKNIVSITMPTLHGELINDIVKYIDGDLRKIKSSQQIYKNQHNLLTSEIIKDIFRTKVNNEFSKDLTKILINNHIDISDHNIIINETDRTSLSLLFHENIIDVLNHDIESNKYYRNLLYSYCYGDYLDRITFQKQIWIFNELTSLIKTIRSNNMYYSDISSEKQKKITGDIRFTKILTKYSTEYNNMLFINKLCSQMQLDKSDMLDYFMSNKELYENNPKELYFRLSDYEITNLEVDRIYRFLSFVN